MNSTKTRFARYALVVTITIAIALPFMISGFQTFQLTQVLVYSIAILGLNVLIGFNGQISLGHGAFYAIGAYSVAILSHHMGVPYWLCVPIAGAVSFCIGLLFGFPALRLEGHYLALATFALALAVPQILKHSSLQQWTGGVQGIFIPKPKAPFGLPLTNDQWLYFFVLAVVLLMFFLAFNLLRGRVGYAIRAIRDNPTAAEAMGINNAAYKSITFGVSAFYTGIAGGLGAIIVQFVAPDSFTMFLSVFLFVGVVVGGVGSVPGAFIGGGFVVFMPNIAADISKAATNAVFGILLILLMYFMRNGVWGAIERVSNIVASGREKVR